MPPLNARPITIEGPFKGLDFFLPRTKGMERNKQKHMVVARNIRCKEHVVRTAPGNCRIPSRPASDTPYNHIAQWPVLDDNRTLDRLFFGNGSRIFRGDFIVNLDTVILLTGSTYADVLESLLGNPPGFDLANYPGIDTLLEDVVLGISGPLTHQFDLCVLNPNQKAVYAAEAVTISDLTIKFDDSFGNPISTSFEKNAIIRNAQTGEYLSVINPLYSIFANQTIDDVTTTLDVDDGAGNSVFANLRSSFVLRNIRSGEQLLISAAPVSDTITITRGHNGTTAEAILDDDQLETDRTLVTRATFGFFTAAIADDDEFVQVTSTYKWAVLEGLPGLTFSDDTSPNPLVTVPASGGSWIIRAAIDDGFSVICHDISLIKGAPISVNAGVAILVQTTGVPAVSVPMVAGATGLEITTVWTQVSGNSVSYSPNSNVLNPSVVFPPIGNEFLVRLTVQDLLGNTVSDLVSIIRNTKPIITMLPGPSLPSATPLYIVSEASVVDPDNYPNPMTFNWSL